jgi:hypothetical protein
MKWLYGFLLASSLMFVDHYRPLPFRKCEVSYVIDTPERAREYAFAYWRANESRVRFGGKRYRTADEIISGLMIDGKLEIYMRWSFLNFEYQWFVGGEILKFKPEYYGFGLTFNRCGRVLEHEKVGHG